MLREIASTQRINRHKSKRWFTDSEMDLFIWFKNQRPVCFQLIYKKQQQEYSISWHINTGFSHNLIKARNHQTRYKISPGHSSRHEFDAAITARNFLQTSDHIEATLADFIFARLIEAPGQLEIRSDQALASEG